MAAEYVDVYFKTPDAVQTVIDRMMLDEDAQVLVKRQCAKYIEYGECVKIRIYLDTGKAEVSPVK
jgi:hypothetical protein